MIYANYLGKRRDWSVFRRFTYFVSKEFTNKTFLQRIGDGDFSSLEKIKDAFSVEKVTKEFYQDIANWYFWAVQSVSFPKDAEGENSRNIAVIRLITRMIFIWFMREQGLVPKNLFEEKSILAMLKDVSPESSTYYQAILQNLFFATLSTKKDERKFRSEIRGYKGYNPDFGNQNVFRFQELFKNPDKLIDFFGEIPFLNGGLFECLDDKPNGFYIDGFTAVKKNQPNVPNFLFLSREQKTDLNTAYGTKNKTYKVRGLLDILSSFNFTIDENSPDDQDIALDPELLGRVFENLLASFNPETSTTARKATGSYYTPREIVDYMVTESLKAYFKTHLLAISDLDKKIDKLFLTGSGENPFDKSESKKIVELIESVRIVDPAVGSGAFPMGALNKLVFILNKVDPGNELWEKAQLSAADAIPDPRIRQDTKSRIEEFFKSKNADYGRKLYLIQKCIYGVDIQQIAVEIAKLRFFISLLVDEGVDKTKENWGIEPLPNLDFKIMQGNSLISEFLGIDFDNGQEKQEVQSQVGLGFENEDDSLIKEFERKKIDYQNESDKDKKTKLKNEVEDLMIKIFESKVKKQKAGYFKDIEEIERKYSILPNKQSREEIIAKEKQKLSQKTGFDLENIEKQLREFTSKKKTRPFFPWKLYFAEVFEKGGFDVVIANPPYVRQEEIKEYKPLLQKSGYQVFNSTSDLYTYFYELSYNILAPDGFSCFISSNKWMRAKYGEKLRRFFKEYTRLISLINFGCYPVFEAAVDTNIILLQKAKPDKKHKLSYVNMENGFSANNGLIDYIRENQNILLQEKLDDNAWTLAEDKVLQLKEKIERIGTPLKDWDVRIYRGIITGFNEAFIINNETKERLCKEDPKSAEILKPILRGRDIKKYSYKWAGLWLTKIESGWTDKNRGKKDPEKFFKETYPAVYGYLKSMGEKKGKGKGLYNRDDKGDYWWELRDCAYYPEFEKEKIVYPDIAGKLTFAYENKNYFLNNTGYFLNASNRYLLAILNSLLTDFYYRQISSRLGNEAMRTFTVFIEQLPIPIIDEAKQKPFIEIADKILVITGSGDYLANSEKQARVRDYEKQIDQLVYKLYGLTPEEREVVENPDK